VTVAFIDSFKAIEASKKAHERRLKEDPLNNINTWGIDQVIMKSMSKLKESLRSSWVNDD
jgi:hypothetical protein